MEPLKIIITSTLLAIFYGICHDLITANISVEYFTIGHPKIIESTEPLHLALAWGIVATWWGGLIIGICISIAARVGKNPKLKFTEVLKPMMVLIFVMAVSALSAGLIGYILVKYEIFYLAESFAAYIEPERHHLFLTAGWAHAGSYVVGFLGGFILCIKLWRKRNVPSSVT